MLKKKPRKKLGKRKVLKKKKPAPVASILDQIKPVTELKTNLVMMVYGRSGTGKTHFGSTFPRPILFIDTNERGTETIAMEEDIDVVRITEWGEIDELYWALLDKTTETEYASIVVDQVSHDRNVVGGEIPDHVHVGLEESQVDAHRIQVEEVAQLTALDDGADLLHRASIHERVIDMQRQPA